MNKDLEESKRIIRKNSKNNKLIIFIGAGVSANSGIPLWGNIIEKIKTKINIEDKENDYPKIAQYYYNSRNKKEYYEFLNSELNIDAKPNQIHDKLLELNPCHIITTNFDELIEKQAKQKGMFYDIVCKDSDLPYTPNSKMIIKMHGDFQNKNIIFKEDDFLTYPKKFKLIETYIKSLFSTHTVLFVGYSLSDPNVKYIFQWVKEILKEDIPRPYFLSTHDENIHEYQYYQNKGINILYYSKVDEKLRKKLEENCNEIKSLEGKKLYGFIKYLLNEYEIEDKTSDVYEFMDSFEKINYIDSEEVLNFLSNKIGIKANLYKDQMILKGSKANKFVKQVREDLKNKKYSITKLIEFLNKSEIKYIKLDNLENKDKIIYRNKNPYEFLKIAKALEILDYNEMLQFVENTEENEIENDYQLYMEKAYAMYYIENYYNAYKEYKKISDKALQDKDFVIYALSEFNRYNIGKIIINNMYSEEYEEIVRSEIEKMDLDKVLLKKPFKLEELEFLKSIFTWSYINSKTYQMLNIKKKVYKDANTNYLTIPETEIGIYQLRENMKKLMKFIKNNLLVIDRLDELKGSYYDYIDNIFKSYVVPKKKESFFGNTIGNIKIEKLILFDLLIMLEYTNTQDLEDIFERYEITEIKIDEKDKERFLNIIKNCIYFIKNREDANINTILLILSKIKINKEQYKEINECIIKCIKNQKIEIDYNELNNYIYNQYEQFNNFELSTLSSMLTEILNNLKEFRTIPLKWECIIYNISACIHKNDKKYELQNNNIVDDIIKINDVNKYSIMIYIYDILNKNDKIKLNKIIEDKLSEDRYEKKHCIIYYEALLKKIIEPNIEYENKYIDVMENQRQITEKSTLLITLLRCINDLILNDYILEKEKFKSFLGIIKDYDFLFDIYKFQAEKFEVDWLDNYSEDLIETISKNKKIRNEVKRQIEKKILDGEKVDGDLLKKYVKYFN